MRRNTMKTITAFMLVIAMAIGMIASLGGRAKAATPINIAYAAGDDAKIKGGPVYNVPAYAGVPTKITTERPTRSGCNFLGWTTEKNSGRIDYKPGASATFEKGITLWPVWNANIAYAAGDGAEINGSPVANVSVTLGKKTTVPSIVPEKTGYEFLGWSTIKNSGIVQYKRGATITYTRPITLWPVWDTKCMVLYLKDNGTDNIQFQEDTPIFRDQLRSYIIKRVPKASITVKGFSSWQELVDGWNNMPNDQGVVIINCHGWPTKLYYTFGIYDVNKYLKQKNIKTIILVACNCGHLENYDSDLKKCLPENIAVAFAKKFKCVVYASDGNVKAFTLESGLAEGKPGRWELYNAPSSTRKQNKGWLVYDGRNYKSGEISPSFLGLKSGTTIGGLLDAYYSKKCSW